MGQRGQWPLRRFDYINLAERVGRTASFLGPQLWRTGKYIHKKLQERNSELAQETKAEKENKKSKSLFTKLGLKGAPKTTKRKGTKRKMPRHYGSRLTRRRQIRGRTPLTKFRRKTGGSMRSFRRHLNAVLEWKYHASTQIDAAVTPAGNVLDLCIVTQGAAESQRIGNELNMSSIRIRGHLYGNTAATLPAQVRLVMFQWVPIGAPTVSDILKVIVSLETEAFWNRDTADMYKIRWNRTFKVSNVVASGEFNQLFDKKVVIPYEDRTVKFNVGTSNATGKMYIIAITNAITNAPTISWEAVMNYSDP